MMKQAVSTVVMMGALVGLMSGAAQAAEAEQAPLWGFVSEVRGGVLLHDVWRPEVLKEKEKDSFDINFEMLSTPVTVFDADTTLEKVLLQPRVHLGGSVNLDGYTHHVYSGFTWGHQFESGPYVDGSFGMTLHNGQTEYTVVGGGYVLDGRPQLGSSLLFREAFEVGYRLDSGHGMGAMIEHMSHAGLFSDQNDGMTFLGLRYSYRFD